MCAHILPKILPRLIPCSYSVSLSHGVTLPPPHPSSPRSISTNSINLAEIEKLVDSPLTFLEMEHLQNDEIFYLMSNLQKLMGSGHPIVEFGAQALLGSSGTFKIHGIISLLLSQLINHLHENVAEPYDKCHILPKQRKLVEVCEMVSTALYLHDNITSLSRVSPPPSAHPSTSSPATLHDYKTGNKLSLLFGDYFLSTACSQLATMDNPGVVAAVSSAIARNVEGRFWLETIDPDKLPTARDLESYCSLKHGALLSSCCYSMALLNGNSRDQAVALQRIGDHVGQALQLKKEALELESSGAIRLSPGIASSYPFIVSLLSVPETSAVFKAKAWDERVIRDVVGIGDGIQRTKEQCAKHCEQAKDAIIALSLDDEVTVNTIKMIDNINSDDPVFKV